MLQMHLLECDSLEPEAQADASAFHSVFPARALNEDDLPRHNDDVDKESTSSLAIQAMRH
jgi:hypothetical protein